MPLIEDYNYDSIDYDAFEKRNNLKKALRSIYKNRYNLQIFYDFVNKNGVNTLEFNVSQSRSLAFTHYL